MSATYALHIAGEEIVAATGGTYETLNPFTGRPWARVADGGADDVDAAVRAARAALRGPWGAMTAPERAGVLRAVADGLEQEADRLARLETTDNGKLLRETAGQMAAIPSWFRYFAGVAETARGETIPTAKANFLAYTVRDPVGVVGAIVPWNSPLLLLAWKLAPALAAGCTMVVKPSDHTPVTAIEFARCLERAGLPAGVLNVVTGWGPATGKALAEHPDVDLVAFTGSTDVGKDEAIEKANATRFGLAAGVWTIDVGRAHRVASRLRAGTVWVNSYRVVAPQVPFGGVGDSGWGRESGTEAMHAFTETKAVWIELDGQTRDPFRMG